MNNFAYDIPTRVYFGENQLGNLGAELSKYGKKVLMTYGGGSIKNIGLYDKIVTEIKNAGLELFELSGIDPNPRVSSVNAGAEICKQEDIDVLHAVGGGSVLDCTKYIGAVTYYDGISCFRRFMQRNAFRSLLFRHWQQQALKWMEEALSVTRKQRIKSVSFFL